MRWESKVHLTACLSCFLSNISAKNYQNWLMYVKVVASQSSVIFFETHCIKPQSRSH